MPRHAMPCHMPCHFHASLDAISAAHVPLCLWPPLHSPCSPVVPGKTHHNQAELALQSYKINPVCKEHMPGMAWAHPHQ